VPWSIIIGVVQRRHSVVVVVVVVVAAAAAAAAIPHRRRSRLLLLPVPTWRSVIAPIVLLLLLEPLRFPLRGHRACCVRNILPHSLKNVAGSQLTGRASTESNPWIDGSMAAAAAAAGGEAGCGRVTWLVGASPSLGPKSASPNARAIQASPSSTCTRTAYRMPSPTTPDHRPEMLS
jgi:hypothetical protein